jgi:serine/threonine-protein kinase
VSAALAAVIDRATAKHLARRYTSAREMVADLEKALAIETARSGGASGEAGAVLRTLPPSAARQVPMRARHPSSVGATIAVVVLAGAAFAVFALMSAHSDRPQHRQREATEVAVGLAGATAVAYNPFGTGPEHAALAPLTIDGKPATAWTSSTYDGGRLGKPGVGVYVAFATPVRADRLVLTTPTPGFTAQVWGAQRLIRYRSGTPQALAVLGWRRLGGTPSVRARTRIELHTAGARLRYYLVWITQLPPASAAVSTRAEIGEIALRRAGRG